MSENMTSKEKLQYREKEKLHVDASFSRVVVPKIESTTYTPEYQENQSVRKPTPPSGAKGGLVYNLPPTPSHDPVVSPAHYRSGSTYETIRVIEAWGLGFNLGNTIKYISRAGKKKGAMEDLLKARWYLDREIANMQRNRIDKEHADAS